MDSSIIIALVGALINIMLSVIVPCVFKRTDNSMMNDMREVYKTNRQMIFSSSMIIGITIYLALEFTPQLKEAIGNLVELSEPQLSNLARL
jgi:phosphotransferase system  glucose/maltose/N-acetylglucosamine-specific IIC component